jgi:hypothetical protein
MCGKRVGELQSEFCKYLVSERKSKIKEGDEERGGRGIPHSSPNVFASALLRIASLRVAALKLPNMIMRIVVPLLLISLFSCLFPCASGAAECSFVSQGVISTNSVSQYGVLYVLSFSFSFSYFFLSYLPVFSLFFFLFSLF